MEEDRILTSTRFEEDGEVENSLRPKTIDEYIGQSKIKANLEVFISAAKKRGDALDHVLLYGPPGLGKTTLAAIIANELGVQFRQTSGPAIEKAGDLAAILTNLEENSVLFIDEIHRMNKVIEEMLYPALEDFSMDIILGQGPSARTVKLPLKKFTLIGATTKSGMISSPLRDRFGVMCRLEIYSPDELRRIIERSARIVEISIDGDAALEIAKRSRGTPRIANRLLKRVRDFAEVKNRRNVDVEMAKEALNLLEVDEIGLDFVDRRILESIIKTFDGGPVGLETLAAATGEDSNTIEDMYEPYLLQLGFIKRTTRGRVCLPAAYKHLGIKIPKNYSLQSSFFDEEDE